MPRSISWKGRLSEIHRQVKESTRTPYMRADLERMFRVKVAAAKELMSLMPRIEQGNSTVVERQALLDFLAGALDAEDLSAYLHELRKAPPKPSRRKIRIYVPRDFEAGTLRPLSAHEIFIKRGRLEMQWSTFEDFCSKMMILVGSIEDPAFERRYCEEPPPSPQQKTAAAEVQLIRAHNKYVTKISAACMADEQGLDEIATILRAEAAATLIESQELSASLGIEPEPLQLLDAKIAEVIKRTSSASSQTASPDSSD